jgi:hypothetical protein
MFFSKIVDLLQWSGGTTSSRRTSGYGLGCPQNSADTELRVFSTLIHMFRMQDGNEQNYAVSLRISYHSFGKHTTILLEFRDHYMYEKTCLIV